MQTRPVLDLTRMRKQHALSQEEVAARIGTTQANLSRWERGVSTPTPYYVRKLCELFNKNPDELFADHSEHVPDNLSQDLKIIFNYNTTLKGEKDFYGRKREKLHLLSRVRRGDATSIVGSRRIGKSWLLHYLRLVAPTQLGDKYLIGYIDATAPNCATLTGFTTEILHVLNIARPEDSSCDRNLVALQAGVEAYLQQGSTPILCIDEFEGLCKTPDFHLGFLEHLRAIAQLGLGLVIATKRRLIDISTDIMRKEGLTSPFFNTFMEITLKPFSRQEATQFCQEKGREALFTEQEISKLMHYGQQPGQELWSPLRLQLVGTLLQEDKFFNAITEDEVYWQDFDERVEYIYKGVMKE